MCSDARFFGPASVSVSVPLGNSNVASTFFGTRFENCDFRGANLTGRRLKDTVFERCKFHDIQGKPVMEGPYRVIDPDFSVEGDRSDIREEGAIAALWT